VSIVTVMLAMALVVAALGSVVRVWDPELQRRGEAGHAARLHDQLAAFGDALDGLALGGHVGASVKTTLDLGATERGLLSTSRTFGSVALLPGTTAAGSEGLVITGALVQRLANQTVENFLVNQSKSTYKVLGNMDRGNNQSLTKFEIRPTDVSWLAPDGDPGQFRVVATRAGLCEDETCPQLQLSPQNVGNDTDYDGVIWIASFYKKANAEALEFVVIDVWNSDGGNGPGAQWMQNGERAVNGQTLNLLCDLDSGNHGGAWCPVQTPYSILDYGTNPNQQLQLYPKLFPDNNDPGNDPGNPVPGERYDIWFVNGNRAFGTFNTAGTPPGAGGGSGAEESAFPIPPDAQPLEVRLDTQRLQARTLRIEHGGVVLQQGLRDAMVQAPPLVFKKLDAGHMQVTLRLMELSGNVGMAGAGDHVTLSATLRDQRQLEGTASLVNLSLPVVACDPWLDWLHGSLGVQGIAPWATASCADGTLSLTLVGPSADSGLQDLAVDVLWTGFDVEVGA